MKGFRRYAALEVFGRARLDGFAFDAEVLFLARRLGLVVSEVPVRAEERDGSKVQLVVDALGMLARRAAGAPLGDKRRLRPSDPVVLDPPRPPGLVPRLVRPRSLAE